MEKQKPALPTLADRLRKLSADAMHLNKNITFFCARYFYSGKIVEIGEDYCVLAGAEFPWETGAFDTPTWENSAKFPHDEWTIMFGAIESFGVLK